MFVNCPRCGFLVALDAQQQPLPRCPNCALRMRDDDSKTPAQASPPADRSITTRSATETGPTAVETTAPEAAQSTAASEDHAASLQAASPDSRSHPDNDVEADSARPAQGLAMALQADDPALNGERIITTPASSVPASSAPASSAPASSAPASSETGTGPLAAGSGDVNDDTAGETVASAPTAVATGSTASVSAPDDPVTLRPAYNASADASSLDSTAERVVTEPMADQGAGIAPLSGPAAVDVDANAGLPPRAGQEADAILVSSAASERDPVTDTGTSVPAAVSFDAAPVVPIPSPANDPESAEGDSFEALGTDAPELAQDAVPAQAPPGFVGRGRFALVQPAPGTADAALDRSNPDASAAADWAPMPALSEGSAAQPAVADDTAVTANAAAPPAPPTAAQPQTLSTTPSFVRVAKAAEPVDRRRKTLKIAAIALLALTLALQLLLSQRASLAADARWRPILASLCGALRCTLPPWREPQAFTLLERDISAHAAQPGVLRVSARMRNDARWPQPWPVLQLTLSDAHGRDIATRMFVPREYLGGAPTQNTLASGQDAALTMDVVEPGAQAVAFTFDFR